MEKELLQLYETVKEAADATVVGGGAESNSEVDRCLEGLQRLKEFPVTSELLVSTQVGKRLRQLTKHPQNKIQSTASEVLGIWKQIVIQETDKKRKNGFTESEGSVKVESSSLSSGQVKKFQRVDSIKAENGKKSVTAVAPTDSYDSKKSQTGSSLKIEKVSATASLKVEKFEYSSTSSNSFKAVKSESSTAESVVKTGKNTNTASATTTTAVESREKRGSNLKKPGSDSGVPKLTTIPQTKDKLRDKFREILAEALCKVSSEVNDGDLKEQVNLCDPNRVAVMIESSLFQKWGGSTGLNKAKYRSVMFNIKDPKNPDFRRRVLLGEYPADSIVDLPPEEMASDERKQQNNQIKEKALFDCERGLQPKASTDQFRCGRCGKKETTYYQLQTRSADEPMTTFVTCVNCNNHWKFC